ncbi:hypothetical protein KS4_34510 [Poriferisphaera corsica]|uniref:Lipoprotein n=1 Tax=Poriferisphaera corsica TaxID=2528020 RepID=A0A517YYQ7_9BACT|nr:hypothetical protein [Poriferisphaera corsica]QDU35370.1 hypothetical protein KS4_34510 [Poriferisphaera corsica]
MRIKQSAVMGFMLLLVMILSGCALFKAEDKWLREDKPMERQAIAERVAPMGREYRSMIETWLGFRLPKKTIAQYASQSGSYEQHMYMRFESTDAGLLAILSKMSIDINEFVTDEFTKGALESYIDEGLFGAAPLIDDDKKVFLKDVVMSRNSVPARAEVYLVRLESDKNIAMIHISMY